MKREEEFKDRVPLIVYTSITIMKRTPIMGDHGWVWGLRGAGYRDTGDWLIKLYVSGIRKYYRSGNTYIGLCTLVYK